MLKKILYTTWIAVFFIFIIYTIFSTNFNTVLDAMENRTFDIRQGIIVNSEYKKANSDIIIVAIDDASYEYILDRYGEWPLPRNVYANIINFIEQQNPKSIAFDLMFVKSLKSTVQADSLLIETFAKYNNLFLLLISNNQSVELRTPANLPDKLKVNLVNNSKKVDFDTLSFQNCRSILPGIINATSNIGMINVSRADDGILRKMPILVKYQDDYYPQLALKVGMHLIGDNNIKNFVIDKNSNLIINDRKIFLDNDGSAILNWYGSTGTYKQIPIYKIIKAIENGNSQEFDFKNKVVYFGTTAASLFDIKTTPTAKLYPGVEVQATYVNNFIDNNFIKKIDKSVTIPIAIILAVITGIIVTQINSTAIVAISSVTIYSIYIILSYLLMKYGNIWLDIVYPLILGLTVFITAFIIKYVIKSQDFDRQYKLATTDGLTELYNHRYFQEQMRMQVEQSKRYGQPFSLIIIDIDFFKQFNDKFGHQAGDAVLKQVAQLLKHNIRATDIACRYGGEEMSIILPNTSKELSYITADKICKRVAGKKFKLNNQQEGNVTISLGVATFPDDSDNASGVIEVADKRLYQSKNNGRNQVN